MHLTGGLWPCNVGAGRRHVGRQLAEPGRGGREDEAQGGGRDEARESPRLLLLPPGTYVRTLRT